jgi:hypothetical protein
MDQGRMAEYDTPVALMSGGSGAFRGMVESSGEADVLRTVIIRNSGSDTTKP